MENEKDFFTVKVQFDKKNSGTLILNNSVERIKELMDLKIHRNSIIGYQVYKHIKNNEYELVGENKKEKEKVSI